MKYAQYIEVPFKPKGRDFSGCDCWGLVYQFYKHEKNIVLPLLDTYTTPKDVDTIQEIIERERGRWYRTENPVEGDVVVMYLKNRPTHVGIYLEGHRVLHTHEGINSCHEPLDGMRWRNRIEGFYKYE